MTNWFSVSGKVIWFGEQNSPQLINTNQMFNDLKIRIEQLEERVKFLELNVDVLNQASSSYSSITCCRGKVKADDGVSRNQEIDNACKAFTGKQCLQQEACELTTDC